MPPSSAAQFEHVDRRIHYARIDIAFDSKIEQIRAVLRIVEFVSDRLIDRHRYRFRRGVRLETGVRGECLVFHC